MRCIYLQRRRGSNSNKGCLGLGKWMRTDARKPAASATLHVGQKRSTHKLDVGVLCINDLLPSLTGAFVNAILYFPGRLVYSRKLESNQGRFLLDSQSSCMIFLLLDNSLEAGWRHFQSSFFRNRRGGGASFCTVLHILIDNFF